MIRSIFVVASGAGLFLGACKFYNGDEIFYKNVVMPAVRLLPPEISHRFAVLACKYNMIPASRMKDDDSLTVNFFQRTIPNPIGIAAGFDKNGEAIEGLAKMGFGFVEIGTVTPKPQAGNPEPRLFRLPLDEAVINRYGFNSDGYEVVSRRIKFMRGSFRGALGVNLGKNKNSESPVDDYVEGVKTFGPIVDFLVINVSSPNTPGLRQLQTKNELEKLLEAVVHARNKLEENCNVPILLKLSPDLKESDIADIAAVVTRPNYKIDGLIISNTTVCRPHLKEEKLAKEKGGLSGPPLRERSTRLIADVYYATGGKIPIIGVGGVSSGRDALEKILAGASYIQLYTALVYNGPPVVAAIKRELSDILYCKEYQNIKEAVGQRNAKYRSKC